jgi:hypothetical protein
VSADRTYWHIVGTRSWHAHDPQRTSNAGVLTAICGYTDRLGERQREHIAADRVPSRGHLCQNCGRSIAARTDIETDAADLGSDYGTFAEGVPI